MNWTKATRANLAALPVGTVCWCYNATLRKTEAGVWKGDRDGFRCHGQEHFSVLHVTRFFVLPAR